MISPMNESFKYFAFISYKREDEEWAVWLQHELEYYHLPASLNGREDLPKEFRPVFRDIDELKAGNLPEQIHHALASSAHLIVICSPRSANSKWVNKEIEDFIEIGRQKGINNLERVFPFIVEGQRHDPEQECFPKYLRELPDEMEILGGNVNDSGRDKAFVKIIAGMLPNVSMDMLWNRYERDKAEEERRKREERDRLLIMQSRFISEKVFDLAEFDSYLARLLALEVIPKDLSNPDRPMIPEAESALRSACSGSASMIWGPSKAKFNDYSFCFHHFAFSPDGKRIATTSSDNFVRIWNIEDSSLLLSFDKHTDQTKAIAYAPDGKHIASSSEDGSLLIWNPENGEEEISLIKNPSPDEPIDLLSFSPDGHQIVSVSSNSQLTVWNLNDGSFRHLTGHTSYPHAASFSPDSKSIISVASDGIRIWDAHTGKPLNHLEKDSEHFVILAAYSSDGKHIVSIHSEDDNSSIKVWDAKSKKHLKTIPLDADATNAALRPDGKQAFVISSQSGSKIWDIESEEALYSIELSYAAPLYSPDGNQIAWNALQDLQNIHIVKLNQEKRVFNIDHSQNGSAEIRFTTFSPIGSYIIATTYDDKTLVLDASSATQIHHFNDYNKTINQYSFSPDGNKIILHNIDNRISIYDLKTGLPVSTINILNGDYINHVSFSPDGTKVLSVLEFEEQKKSLIVWETATGTPVLRMMECAELIDSASFSPDGKLIAMSCSDYSYHKSNETVSILPDEDYIIILDSSNGNLLKAIRTETGMAPFLLFSPDGKRLLTISSGYICATLWDVESGDPIYTIEYSPVKSAAFSPDGNYIVTTNDGGRITVWETASGAAIQTLDISPKDAHSAQFHPNGRQIIASFDDNVITVYDFLPFQELIDQTRERFKNRPLTTEERTLYYLD